MRRRIAHLLATERHVDAVLRQGQVARTWRDFLRHAVSTSDLAPATPEVTNLATSMAVESLQDELGWAPGHAVVGALDDAVGMLRRAGTDVGALRRVDHVRADVLARFLERTDQILAGARLFDDRAIGFVAARCIDGMSDADLPAAVVIDGLYEWDMSVFAWVEALARRIPVTVRMPRPTPTGTAGGMGELGSAPDLILAELENRWQDLPEAPEIELFEAILPESVALFEGANGAAEARVIVDEVGRALAAGVDAEAIAVVVPALREGFLEMLRAAFGEARISFAEPRGRPPSAAPPIRAAMGWLDLSVELHRDGLIDLLRSSAIDPAPFIEGATLEVRRRGALALAARLARIPVGTDVDRTLLLQVLSAEIEPRSSEGWMFDALERIVVAVDDLAEPASRAVFVAKLIRSWEAMRLPDATTRAISALLASDAASLRAHMLSSLAREEAAGLWALVDAAMRVESAAAALGESESVVSPARFRAELEEALAGASPRGTRRPGAVRVVRPPDAARLGTEILIVAGASDGMLSPSAASSLMADDFLAGLPRGRRPLSSRQLGAAAQTELLCAIASTRRLIVTRSATDSDGRPASPAPFFSDLSAAHAVPREPASALSPGARLLSPRAEELVALSAGVHSAVPDVARRVSIERERLTFFFDPRLPAGAVTGAVAATDAVVRERLRDGFGGTKAKPIAATAIERAALCRFAAFSVRVLGASTTDTVGEGLEPWQRGSLIHRALHAAFEAIRPHLGSANRAEIEQLAREAAGKAVLRENSSPLYRAEVNRALRDVAAVVSWSLDDDSGLVFAHAERSFGEVKARRGGQGEPWPALAIGEGAATIFVAGRIDRIDASRDGSRVRVIDYKTGSLPAWKDLGTRLFQPPLYAYAVLRQMGQLSVSEVRALYLDTSKRPVRTLPAEDKQVLSTHRISEAQKRASEIVLKLWSGDVAPRPADALVCGRCDVRDVCRRPAAMPIEDLEQDIDGGNA